MLRKETVSVQLSEIEELIKNVIRKKYGFDKTVDLHRTSKTTFLTYSVIRDGNIEGCDCQDCESQRLQDTINRNNENNIHRKKMKVEIIDKTEGDENYFTDTTTDYVKGTIKIQKIKKEKGGC